MRTILLGLLIAVSPAGTATVYKIVNPDGTVTYSDRPQAGAEEVDVGTVQTYEAPTGLAPAGESAADAPAYPEYQRFEVASPEPDETFRDNGGVIPVRLALEPGLFRDHTISIFMDGKDLGGGGRSTSLTLENVDRGSHTVYAVILDAAGKEILRTPGVTFHLHRTSKLIKPGSTG